MASDTLARCRPTRCVSTCASWRTLEAQARIDKAAIRDLEAQARGPLRLPSPEQITRRVLDLEAVLNRDVERGRAALRELLREGQISLEPGVDGIYTAVADLLPLRVLLLDTERPEHEPGPLDNVGCGGGI